MVRRSARIAARAAARAALQGQPALPPPPPPPPPPAGGALQGAGSFMPTVIDVPAGQNIIRSIEIALAGDNRGFSFLCALGKVSYAAVGNPCGDDCPPIIFQNIREIVFFGGYFMGEERQITISLATYDALVGGRVVQEGLIAATDVTVIGSRWTF